MTDHDDTSRIGAMSRWSRRRVIAFALALVVSLGGIAFVVTLVSNGTFATGGSGQTDDTDSPVTGSGADDSDSTEGSGATDPNSPFVVAASAVATRSRDQVLQLHAMAVSTTGESDFPQDQIPALGESIRDELRQQVADATMATPPRGSAAEQLVTALESYQRLADQIATWDATAAEPLPDEFFSELESTDEQWKDALTALGALAGKDLLENLPELVMPR